MTHAARQADALGVRVAGLTVDGAAVMARVRRERDRFMGFALDTLDSWPAAHRLRGRARFIGPGRLALDDGTQIDSGRVVIATGARPSVPEAWRAAAGRHPDLADLDLAAAGLPVDDQGVLRVYGRRGDGHLLGAELFGPDAEHLAHLLAWAVQRGDGVAQLLDQPFYHPVLEEGLRTALQALARALHGSH